MDKLFINKQVDAVRIAVWTQKIDLNFGNAVLKHVRDLKLCTELDVTLKNDATWPKQDF